MIVYNSVMTIADPENFLTYADNGKILPLGLTFKTREDRATFNEPVEIGVGITGCSSLFEHCRSFNQPITIPNNVINCTNMFAYCWNFNQPVTIPNNANDCSYMFFHCTNFNHPVNIPNNAINCKSMFLGCYNFNQPIIIPNSVIDCSFMFSSCTNFCQNIYFKGQELRDLNVSDLFYNANGSLRKKIFFNSALNSIFNQAKVNYSSITWETIINGFYNLAYNIYCYYNYSG